MKMTSSQIRHGLALLAFLLAFSAGSTALAAEKTPGEVFVVLATDEEGTIDPALSKIRALGKPPFNAFRAMKVESRSAISLETGKPVTVALPNGRRLMLTLKELMKDGRARVQLSINRPDKKDYLPLLEVKAKKGEPFFVAGQKYKGGTLIIGVRVGDKSGK
jgi:hypothetical protein